MKNRMCMDYLMHASALPFGGLDALGAQQDKHISDSLVKQMQSLGAPDSVANQFAYKQVTATSPITGNTYSADTPYSLGTGMIKGDAQAIVNNALNASAEAARKKQLAKNQNLRAQLAGGSPMSRAKVELSDDDMRRRQYMHEYYKKHAAKWKPGGPYYYYQKAQEDAKNYKPVDAIGDHLEHGFLGDFFKKHKYFRREETTDGQKNKYRYFYSADEWNAWKRNAGNAIGNFVNKIGNAVRGVSSAPSSTDPSGFSDLSGTKHIGGSVKKAFKYIAKLTAPNGKIRYFYDEKVLARAKKLWNYWQTDGSFMQNVSKIQWPDEGDDERFITSDDNANAVNPGHRSQGRYRSVNCQFCSLAQELRSRGYNVRASDVPSGITNRTKILGFFGYKPVEEKVTIKCKATAETAKEYKGLKGKVNGLIKGITSSGNWHGLSNYSGSDDGEVTISYTAMKNDSTIKSFIPCQEDPNFVWNGKNVPDENKTTAALLNKMKEYPNGSRGSMNVFWNTGGGHSVSWEKDEEGHLTIRDTQGGNTIIVDGASGNFEGIRRYFMNVNPVMPVEIARLDDKSIVDPKILDYVDSNVKTNSPGLIDKAYGVGFESLDKLAGAFKSIGSH